MANTSRTCRSLCRIGIAATVTAAVLAAGAGTAAAHAEVSASDARALAENVTLTFTSEAESDAAGIKELRVVLPAGIAPDAVSLKEAPKGWALSTTDDGYTVGGTALTAGTDAEHSITVRQLPDAKSLAFKTIETYSDGKVSRWIEVPSNGQKVENPAPVLELKAAAPGAKAIAPSPSPTPSASTPSPAASTPATESSPSAQPESKKSSGSNTGLLVGLIAAALVAVAGATVWWTRRNRSRA
ncbi:DUF1775 domain-containing protein [Streptomyces sp. DT224]|uniref:DUF1775 domain-containing protein n=1 Tax=unclassified Streptomyces TaxID=2593676 RepID=UPI002DDC2519|nr:DUF1775 domain-containing protein [Streptomyces sp. NBC_00385]WRZ03561.1 YcnI family protein [Streptomyces sp. NBC_00385]